MRQFRQGFGPPGGDLVTAETQNYGTAKDAKSAKGVPDEGFGEMLGWRSGSKIGDLKFPDPKDNSNSPLRSWRTWRFKQMQI